jgi:hypothetical protein
MGEREEILQLRFFAFPILCTPLQARPSPQGRRISGEFSINPLYNDPENTDLKKYSLN